MVLLLSYVKREIIHCGLVEARSLIPAAGFYDAELESRIRIFSSLSLSERCCHFMKSTFSTTIVGYDFFYILVALWKGKKEVLILGRFFRGRVRVSHSHLSLLRFRYVFFSIRRAGNEHPYKGNRFVFLWSLYIGRSNSVLSEVLVRLPISTRVRCPSTETLPDDRYRYVITDLTLVTLMGH